EAVVVAEHQCDPVARAHAEPGKPVGHTIAARVQLAEAEHHVALQHGRRARLHAEWHIEQVTQIGRQHSHRVPHTVSTDFPKTFRSINSCSAAGVSTSGLIEWMTGLSVPSTTMFM